jgi:acetyl-CoA acyltransferase
MPEKVRKRAVRVRGHAAAGGRFRASWEGERAPVLAARRAYQMAQLEPEKIDVVELHDATSFAEIHLVEDLGFCPRGQGGPFTASGATSRYGQIPVNPSGGLVSRGHPIGATGLMMMNELCIQLRGEAGVMQVPYAHIGLAENGGGLIGNDLAACAVTILEAAN